MEQTQEKSWKVTKNRALLDSKTFDGRSLLSAVSNMEMFFDFLEDIYEEITPDSKEVIYENSNMFFAEREYQNPKERLYLHFEILKDAISLVWYQLEDEAGEVYGKSRIDEQTKAATIQFSQLDEEKQDEVLNILQGDYI